ncbi:MAG: hypothetical protein M3548_01870 [Actinomycetota bacterium]|nr:hypothetical protein [Actinomycetota bacterium]
MRASWAFVGLGVSLVILPPLLRWLLFSDGEIYGPTRSNYVNAIIAVLAVAGCLLLYRLFSSDTPAPQGGIVLLTGLVGVATAAFALAQFFFPETPRNAAAPACSNASVEGARLLAQTTEQGVNTRAGAGRQFAQVGRFPAGCTVGFDGYCIGEPLPDILLPPNAPDRRWLIAHRSEELVPAAFMLFQGGEAGLGAPDESCDKYGGTDAAPIKGVTATEIPDGVNLGATAPEVALVGYSATEVEGDDRTYVRIGQSDDGKTQFSVPWNIAETNPFTEGRTGASWVAAVHCLAGNAPASGTLRVMRVDLQDGKMAQVPQVVTDEVDVNVQEKLAQMACSRAVSVASE